MDKAVHFAIGGVLALVLLFVIIGMIRSDDRLGEEFSSVALQNQSSAANTDIVVPTSTVEPTATSTFTPTPIPSSTSTPIPSPTSTPFPEPIVFRGIGDKITDDFSTEAYLIAVYSINPSVGHFSVWLKDANTAENVELIANSIGGYNGATLAPIVPGDYYYEVSSDGEWGIVTAWLPQLDLERGTLPYTFSGVGDDISPLFKLESGRADFVIRYVGDGHFAATLFNVNFQAREKLLANDIGSLQAHVTAPVEDMYYVIDIDADGEWEIEVTQ